MLFDSFLDVRIYSVIVFATEYSSIHFLSYNSTPVERAV